MAELITLARPYAKAVFALANDSQNLDGWSQDLKLLSAVVDEETVSSMLAHPSASAQSQQELLIKLVGTEISESAKRFISVLAENDRLLLLPTIEQQFAALKAQMQKMVDTKIVSAVELNDEQVAKLVEALKQRLSLDVKVTQEIDESLIGGVLIHAGDMVIDASIKGKISKLAEAMNS